MTAVLWIQYYLSGTRILNLVAIVGSGNLLKSQSILVNFRELQSFKHNLIEKCLIVKRQFCETVIGIQR